jgi:hypothetical protein
MLLCHQDDGSISTKWYRKPSSSGRIMNFKSAHPLHIKINTACNLIKRVYDLTNPKNNMECYKVEKNILKKFEFPTRIINTLIHKHTANTSDTTQQQIEKENMEAPEKFMSIQYIQGLTEKLAKISRPFNERNKLHPGFKTIKTIKNLHTVEKAKSNRGERSHVVYAVECSCTKHYVGLTN